MMSSRLSSVATVSRGASYLTIQTVVTAVAQVLAFAILARIITPTEVGILAILSLITNLAQTINGGAFQYATMKYVGEYAGTNDRLAAGVFFQTLKLSLILSVPISAFLFLGSSSLARLLLSTASQAQLFKIIAVDILAYGGALPVANGALLGTRRFKASAAIGTMGAVLRQCLIILLILFLKNFVGLAYAWVLSDFATLGGYCLYAVHVLGVTKDPFPFKKPASFSWPLSVGNLVNFAYTWFDRAILIAFVPLASLGVYNAAMYAYSVLVSIGIAVGITLLPIYSNIAVTRGLVGCRRATLLSSRYVSLVMAPLAFGLFATAKPALTLFVGEAYIGGVVPLMILSLAFGLTVLGLVLGPMLTALAKTREIMWITLASVACALVTSYLLLPFTGITGASIARGIATGASLGLTIFVLKRIAAMSVDVEMVWKSSVASAGMAAALIATQLLIYSPILLPVYALIGGVVYLILLRFLKAAKKHDIQLIENYLGSRLAFVAELLSAILLPQA